MRNWVYRAGRLLLSALFLVHSNCARVIRLFAHACAKTMSTQEISKTEMDFDVRFTQTNDVISSSFASITPALGLQLDYNNLIFLRSGVGKFLGGLVSALHRGDALHAAPSSATCGATVSHPGGQHGGRACGHQQLPGSYP